MGEPKLRFKADDGSDFPNWEEKTLGELCEPLTYGMNAAATKFDGENRYIRITDIDDETHAFLSNDVVSPSGELDDKYLVKKGDILLARTGASTGKSYLYHPKDGKLFYAGFLIKAHVLPSSDDYFIYSQTLTDRYGKWVKTTSMRSGQPGINANEYASYSFSVPSLPEQRKIADLLSAVDDVIAAQEAEVAAWEKRKKGVMQKLFSQEVRFKADDGSDFPDWEEKTLGELGCFCSGIGFSERYQGHANLPVDVYKVSDMNISGNEREMLRANNTVDESILKKMKTKAIDQPSIIFAKVGAAIFAERKRIARKPFIVDNNMMVFTPNDENDFEYIYWLTLTLRFASRAQIGALPSYNASDISGFVVNIPSLPEQRKIADCLASLDDVIAKAKDELDAWCELKKGLLQQMFV